MKFPSILASAFVFLILAVGCSGSSISNDPEGTGKDRQLSGEWLLRVDLDQTRLDIAPGLGASFVTLVGGHTVEVKNGPAGCSWSAGTSTLTCGIIFRNLDSDECMFGVRTLYHDSTNPSAIMTGVDYIWPGPTVVPDSAQPINNSGYCVTQSGPGSGGSSEGCQDTWQEYIPSGGIASQDFVFTNVPSGQYTVYLSVYGSFATCSAPAGMVRIPAGCFRMGDSSDGCAGTEECPVHHTCITSDFFMDTHEVTNSEYVACLGAGACTPPLSNGSYSRASYYGNPAYDAFPVIYVSWDQASAYCAWAGKRLPTEAEWEYAARGGLGGRRYPVGDTVVGTGANFWGSGDPWDNDTSPGGHFPPNGYGLFDMTGNMWEWVNDPYSGSYYQYCQDNVVVDDPPGPASGPTRVVRGGGWSVDAGGLRTSKRLNYVPTERGSVIGFRCAAD